MRNSLTGKYLQIQLHVSVLLGYANTTLSTTCLIQVIKEILRDTVSEFIPSLLYFLNTNIKDLLSIPQTDQKFNPAQRTLNKRIFGFPLYTNIATFHFKRRHNTTSTPAQLYCAI